MCFLSKSKYLLIPFFFVTDDNDLIFSLEEDVVLEDITGASAVAAATSAAASTGVSKMRPKSPHQAYSLYQRLQNPPKIQHVIFIQLYILFT